MYRLYGVEAEFLSPTAIKARLPVLRTEDLLVSTGWAKKPDCF